MDLMSLNTEYIATTIVDNFESVIWTERYQEKGEFEIVLPMDTELLKDVKIDYYMQCDESDRTMIVNNISIASDPENGNKLTISGPSLEDILSRRVVWDLTNLDGNMQTEMQKVFDANIIKPTDTTRTINNFVYKLSEDPIVAAVTVKLQLWGETIYDVVVSICKSNNIGFKVTLSDDNQFIFEFYSGTDRTYEQDINPYVVFSPEFDNILNSNYLESKETYKNVAYVLGEGDVTRKSTVVGEVSGLGRRELFVDARDISSKNEDNSTIPEEEYTKLLTQRGTDELSTYPFDKAFEGEADASRMFVYGEDFFMGDLVQVTNEYGNEGIAYISELVLSQDTTGYSIYPTFKTKGE